MKKVFKVVSKGGRTPTLRDERELISTWNTFSLLNDFETETIDGLAEVFGGTFFVCVWQTGKKKQIGL